MKRLAHALVSAVISCALINGVAGAQDPSGVPSVLVNRTRLAYVGRIPEGRFDPECKHTSAPDSLVIQHSSRTPLVGSTWEPGPYRSTWQPVRLGGQEQVTMRLVQIACPLTGPRLLLERNGFHLELDAKSLASVDAEGVFAPGSILLPGGLEQATLVISNGLAQLVPAEPFAATRRAEVAAQREAERVAREKAETARLAAEAEARRKAIARFTRLGATLQQAEAALIGKPLVGMPMSVVREFLGEPSRRSSEVTRLGTRELWHYPTRLLVADQGRVVEIR